jgi:hypothetical protein
MTPEQIKTRELSSRSLIDPYKKEGKKNKVKINKTVPKKKVTKAMKRATNSRMRSIGGSQYLAMYRPCLRYFADYYNIKPVEAEFLLWAHAYEYYTVKDAMDLFLIGRNLERINMRLKNKHLIVKLYGGYRHEGIDAKWAVSPDVAKFITKYVYGVIEGRVSFPSYY